MPVELTFHRGGTVTVKPMGYPGKTCHEATKLYEQAFEGERVTQEIKPGAAQQVVSRSQQQSIG